METKIYRNKRKVSEDGVGYSRILCMESFHSSKTWSLLGCRKPETTSKQMCTHTWTLGKYLGSKVDMEDFLEAISLNLTITHLYIHMHQN